MNGEAIYRIPPGVEFQRWREDGAEGTGEWVVYHAGSGETLRLSEAAMALLDGLAVEPRDRIGLTAVLAHLLDGPVPTAELSTALDGLLRDLLRHECIEPVPCG